mmetsp:Transcript_54472/g.117932  ORF Transcript_54472/g.117932 Transcript_54472/m.117932 type:complete len:299 (+) Transcript_54472:96-992(+)
MGPDRLADRLAESTDAVRRHGVRPSQAARRSCARASLGRCRTAPASRLSRAARVAVAAAAAAAAASGVSSASVVPPGQKIAFPVFKIDVSDFTPESALQGHEGTCGGPPEVDLVGTGEGNLWATRGTLRVEQPAYEIFRRLTDPEENMRIFSNTASALNYRKLLQEDEAKGLRLFEVSKTGRWRLFGIPLSFESTVIALEDWKGLEIKHRLKKPGAMSYMSGFWRTVPISKRETLVQFYNEGSPNFPLPAFVRTFTGRVVKEMAVSLLEDLRQAAKTWNTKEVADGKEKKAAEVVDNA